MPPFTLLNPLFELVTQTENETVGASAMNFTNELLLRPKHDAASKAAQDLLVLPVVLPHAPLKSQMEVALAQSEVDGIVLVQLGNAVG